MLKSKSFIINGETKQRNGVAEKDIANKVDEAINNFLAEHPEGEYVDLRISANVHPGVGQDSAFITIVLKVPEGKPSEDKVTKKRS